MVPIAIGLNINWVAIGDRFNLFFLYYFAYPPYMIPLVTDFHFVVSQLPSHLNYMLQT